MLRIVATYNKAKSERRFEQGTINIGRADLVQRPDLDLTPDLSVSRRHAKLWKELGKWWLQDVGSAGGTKLNDTRLSEGERKPIGDGDVIQIGETRLKVHLAAPQRDEAGVTKSIDARHLDVVQSAKKGIANVKRLQLLYDLPVRFAQFDKLDALLQFIVDQVLKVIPGAEDGALQLVDEQSDRLILAAHLPLGAPNVSDTLSRQSMQQRRALIWNAPSADSGSDDPPSVIDTTTAAMYAPLLWDERPIGCLSVGSSKQRANFDEEDLRLLTTLAHYASMAVSNQRLRTELTESARLVERLLTNFSPKVRASLQTLARQGRLRPGGSKSVVTLLTSDIRGFTRTAAMMEVDDVVDMLNAYLSEMVECIFRYDGTVDKFVGDAILAVFGSPTPDPNHEEKAVRAALDMQNTLTRLNETRKKDGLVTCEMGIGVHCGEVLHGFIGSEHRLEFTVIGDAVNRTARYCDAAQGGEILISDEVFKRVFRTFQTSQRRFQTKHAEEGDMVGYLVEGEK